MPLQYSGKLYGNIGGDCYIPLKLTSAEVDAMKLELETLRANVTGLIDHVQGGLNAWAPIDGFESIREAIAKFVGFHPDLEP